MTEKEKALRLASRVSGHYDTHSSTFKRALQYALLSGASLREAANTMSIGSNTAKRLLENKDEDI
jgi:transposase